MLMYIFILVTCNFIHSNIYPFSVRFIVIQPRYGNILGGTVIQVIGSNIEFYEHHIYQCHFDGTEVPGAYVASLGHVICISPSLRDQGTVNFCLSISSPLSTSQHCTQYYSCT